LTFSDDYQFGFNQTTNSDLGDFKSGPADGCTMCGLCLTKCPTYQNSKDPKLSPMGRIQLMRQLNLESANKTQFVKENYQALDSCLMCLSCENVCPSQVNYADSLIEAKHNMAPYQQPILSVRLLMLLTRKPSLLKFISSLINPIQHLIETIVTLFKVKNIPLRGFSFLRNGYRQTKSLKNEFNITHNESSRKISLFSGCMPPLLNEKALFATMQVLNFCNVTVCQPKNQGCCGAIHMHNGQKQQAIELATKNINAFDDNDSDAIINIASGCGIFLKNYGKLLNNEKLDLSQKASHFEDNTLDICTYLHRSGLLNNVSFKTTNKKIAIHTPCTMQTDNDAITSVRELLEKIPGISLFNLPDSIICCGAGATNMLTHPTQSCEIRDQTLNALRELKPDILVTSNIGCFLNLQEGVAKNHLDIKVLHPIQVIQHYLPIKEVL